MATKVHQQFVLRSDLYTILKKMHLMFGKHGLLDSLCKLCDTARVLDNRSDWILMFMKVMVIALKRGEWTECSNCTVQNIVGRPDRGLSSLCAFPLLQERIARWVVTEFEISQTVSSKMATVDKFDTFFSLCEGCRATRRH